MTKEYLWVGFGVLADRDAVIEREFKEKGLEVIPRTDRKTGNLLREYQHRYTGHVSDLEKITKAYNEVRHAPDFYDKVPIREFAKDAVDDMIIGSGMEVKVCTSYSLDYPQEIVSKIKWIEQHFKGLKHGVYIIPDHTPIGINSSVKRTDRSMLRNGFFITTDEAYNSIMPGPSLLVLEEACYGKTKWPLISFNENKENYWANILNPKATRKVSPETDKVPHEESTKLSL